jgi:hypothetical protein
VLAMRRWYRDGVPGPHHLFCEGAAAAFLGTAFGWWLFPNEVSLVAIFLASIATSDSIARVLDGNRRAIFERGIAPWIANRRLIFLMLAMFAGTVLGFSTIVLVLPLETAEAIFAYQLSDYGTTSFVTLEFGNVWAILFSNLYVLLFFFIIAMPFRQGGVMLAIAWNASVWGATFGVLARRWALDSGLLFIDAYGRVITACLPHMAAEACAYVLAGFAGVFLSKGLAKHALYSEVLESIGRTVVVMMLLGAGLVVVGAVFEGTVANILVDLLSKK